MRYVVRYCKLSTKNGGSTVAKTRYFTDLDRARVYAGRRTLLSGQYSELLEAEEGRAWKGLYAYRPIHDTGETPDWESMKEWARSRRVRAFTEIAYKDRLVLLGTIGV